MNQNQSIIFNLSFLKKEGSKTIAINYQNKSITYNNLWSIVSKRSLQLSAVNSKIVIVNFQNPIDQIINLLAVIEAGGEVFISPKNELIENSSVLENLNTDAILLFTDTSELQSLEEKIKTVQLQTEKIQENNNIKPKGGLILSGIKNEMYRLSLDQLKPHLDTVVEAFDFKKSTNIFSYKQQLNNDILELILPVLYSNTTLNIIDESLEELSNSTISGILKITKEALYNDSFFTKEHVTNCFSSIVLSSSERITNYDINKLQNSLKNNPEITVTYQLPKIGVSVIQSKITTSSPKKAQSITYTKPFGKCNIQILDSRQRISPLEVSGTLWFESKLLQNSIGKNTALKELNIGGAKRKLRSLENNAKFGTGGKISLLNKTNQEILIDGKTITPDIIEEALNMHPQILVSEVFYHKKQQLLVGLIKMKDDAFTVSTSSLRNWLKKQVTSENVPAHFEIVNKLPVNNLQEMIVNIPAQNFTEIEKSLATIWEEILEISSVHLDDNFFEIGGHSLMAIKLSVIIGVKLGKQISIKDIFTWPILTDMAKFINSSTAKEEINIIARNTKNEVKFPLSFTQEGLWFIDKFQGSLQYHIPVVFEMKGNLNKEILETVFQELILRHKALRTIFVEEEGEIYQQIQELNWNLIFGKKTTYNDAIQEIATFIQTPFDLSKDNMIRVMLIQYGEDSYVLGMCVHHIVFDGWSAYLFLNEMRSLYEAKLNGEKLLLPELSIDSIDYSIWQRDYISGEYLTQEITYWKNQLEGLENLDFPTDFPRPAQKKCIGAKKTFCIDASLREKLVNLSQENRVTLFMTMLTSFKVLLYKYTDQEDICVGSPIAGRNHKELESLVGFLVNTLALRTIISSSLEFTSFLQEVKEVTLNAYLHQEIPFEKIVDAIGIQRETSRTPLFQIMFSMEKVPELTNLRMGDVLLNNQTIDQHTAQFDIDVYMEDNGDKGMEFHIEYDTDLFTSETINKFGLHYIYLLENIVANPSVKIADLSIITPKEEKQLIYDFNNTRTDFSFEFTTDQVISNIALKHPDKIALKDVNVICTYKELATNASKQAALLKNEIQLKNEDIVVVIADRSVAMITAIYGIWKAGGVYLPIHPDLPEDRMKIILEDAKANTIIFNTKYSDTINNLVSDIKTITNLICLDGSPEVKNSACSFYSKKDILQQTPLAYSYSTMDELSYIIYTSGSTGKPKGALVEHKGLLNHLFIMAKDLEMDSESCLAQNASQSFDISIWQMFNTLIIGGTSVVYSKQETLDITNFINKLQTDTVSILQVVPSYLSVLLDEIVNKEELFPKLQYLLVTGETVKKNLLDRWFVKFPKIKVVNAYGPTEAADDITLHIMTESPLTGSIPIGKPVANLNIYIVNNDFQLCPIGVKGEILVSGFGVGRGYINDIEKTNKAFTIDPFKGENSVRLYKTGDIGRYLPNGTIEFFGRKDYQVKVRGYRIELEEIELALTALKTVKEAIVLVLKKEDQLEQLYGFVTVFNEHINTELIRQELSEFLPTYMIPVQLIILNEFPLTPNGKVDRKKLAQINLETQQIQDNLHEVPSTKTEHVLLKIWQELLEKKRIGIHDNFFDLGGHSLKIVRMIAQIKKELNVEVLIKDVIIRPTISGLAKKLAGNITAYKVPQNKIQEDATAITPDMIPLATLTQDHIDTIASKVPGGVQNIQDIYPLSPLQEGMYFHYLMDENIGNDIYVVPTLLSFTNFSERTKFIEALAFVIDRHDVLRTCFLYDTLPQAMQVVLRKVTLNSEEVIVTGENSVKEALENLVKEGKQRIDLSKAPLLELNTAQDTDNYYLVLKGHHIVLDHVGLELLFEEVYEYLNKNHDILPTPVYYRDFIGQTIHKKTSNNSKQYFTSRFKEVETPAFPFDIQEATNKDMSISEAIVTLPKELSKKIRQVSQQLHMSPATLFHAAFGLFTGVCSNRNEQIIFGTVLSGRLQGVIGSERSLGLFMNTLPIICDFNVTVLEYVQQVHNELTGLLSYEQTPLTDVLSWSGIDGNQALFSGIINYRHSKRKKKGKSNTSNFELIASKEYTNYPLNFSVDDFGEHNGFDISMLADERLNATNILSYIQESLHQIIAHISENSMLMKDVSIIPSLEYEKLVTTFNTTALAYPKKKSITTVFTEQVLKTPKDTALVFHDNTMSFETLDLLSNKLANYLLEKGVKKGAHIGILFARGFDMLVSIMGVLKAGCAYVPLDPSLPKARLSFIIQDAAIQHIIYSEENLKENLTSIETKFIHINESSFSSIAYPSIIRKPESIVYIMYTSGTTGTPKGILITDENILTLVYDNGPIQIISDDNVLQWSNYAFDGSTYEIFGSLLCGASLYLIDNEVASDVIALSEVIKKEQITATFLTVALFNSCVDYDVSALESFRVLVFGGDKASFNHVQKAFDHLGPGILANGYGPTETTTFAVTHSVVSISENSNTIPIGKPLSNTQTYILNKNKKVVPFGVSGELYIGGKGVAKSYLNQETLTSEKFIKNPFGEGRLYKTGDLVRWLEDGTIEFIGRIDNQVKIRGYRIELGEIEDALFKYKIISNCCVIAKEDSSGNKRLICYVVAKGNFEKEKAQAFLKESLPTYMVPKLWVELKSIPLTSNGKIAKKELPDPDINAITSSVYIAPRNKKEQQLQEIWQDFLGVDPIGINDNFFELGGHSILATRVISKIKQEMDVEASVKVLFTHPTINELSQELSSCNNSIKIPIVSPQEKAAFIPLSYSQQGMWFLDKLQGTREYHVSGGLRLIGTVDFKILETALKTVINRHEVLRTVIKEKNGIGYQEIASIDKWKLSTIKIEESDNEKEEISKFLNIPFDLSNDYMFRACLYDLGNNKNILACVFHHIASDGWSLPIFINEFTEVYKSLKADKEIALPKLPLQYSDFAIWQRNNIKGVFLENQLSYWENKLNGVIPLSLPTDFVRPSIQSTKGAHIYFELDKSLKDSLNAICKEQEVTLFMLLLSAFKVLLHKYSGQNDICIGTPIANRNQADLETMIGYFVNTLALRSNVDQNLSFQEFLQQVKETTLESYEYQHAPFDKIVERIIGNRDTSITQVFQVMFDLRNIVELKELIVDDLKLTPYAFEEDTAQFDLNFSAEEHKEGISFDMEYCTDLFERATVERMLNHFEELLKSISIDYTQTLSSLKILTAKETQQLLYSFNGTDVTYPLDLTVIDLFKKQVEQTPNNIALSFRGEKMTYKELDEKSNQIANYLIEQGVKEDDLIGICLERSFSLVVGVLSILKSGGAYVPIKPDYPESRINHILEDIDCNILLTDTFSKKTLDKISLKETQLLVLNSESSEFKNYSTTEIEKVYNPNSLAYVIYTSGSTGKPKGALIEHKGLLNHLLLMIDELQLNNEASIAFTAPFTFDISVWQILTSLLVGGKTAIYKEQDLLETNIFIDSLAEEKVTILQLVPSYTSSLLETTSSKKLEELNYLLVTGEAVTKDILDRWFEAYPTVPVVNAYGPAEASDDVSLHIMKAAPKEGLVPIGKPVANTQIYIVDSSGNPCPLGVTGELWIGGIGVGRGYLNLEKLTETKFTKNPFTENGRIYKTGDLGRWLSNGTIEFVGREDDQVKIRGHRIELGEIENILSSIPKVISCCVLVKEDEKGNKNLVGYTVSDNSLSNELFQEALKSKLPEYMVPRLWEKLEKMPLTPNGKIDKKALQKIKLNNQPTKNYELAQTTTEKQLTKIWKELLGVEKIGINDNFFELGGHSLLATRLASTIRKEMNVEIPIQLTFTHPTIALLSKELLLNSEEIVIPLITLQDKPTKIPLSFSQERLWFVDQLQGSLGYHMSGRLELNGNVSIPMIEESFKKLVERHQTLRTVILKSEEGLGYQQVCSSDQWKLNVKKEISTEALEKDILIFSSKAFDLSTDYMLKACMYHTGVNEYTLAIVVHHIASDGWSEGILINELITIYNLLQKGEKVKLSPLPLNYVDYSLWQRRSLTDTILKEQLIYWENSLKGVVPVSFPTDFTRPSEHDASGASVRFKLTTELQENIVSLCEKEGVTLFMFLVSVFKILLSKYNGQEDICIGTPVANRTQTDIENMVGIFVNTLALRTDLSGNPTFKEVLNKVKTVIIGGQDHQLIPFEKVVDKVVTTRDMSTSPLFQVLFVLDNTPKVSAFTLNELEVSIVDNEHPNSKFDVTLRVEENEDGISFDFEYCTALFKKETILQIIQHYKEILKAVIEDTSQPIGRLNMLTSKEITEINQAANTTAFAFEKSSYTIDQLFSEKAKQYPNKIGFVDADKRLTLSEVDELSTNLASHILDKGGADNLIAIYMEPSVEVMIAILAIFKAGAAYLPIDTELPKERIEHIIKDSNVTWMIASNNYVNTIEFDGITINIENTDSWTYSKRITQSVNSSDKLAYVIYTSGSTGKPKGVKINQYQLNNYVQWFTETLAYSEKENSILLSSFAFDLGHSAVFPTLCNGGTLHLPKKEQYLNINYLNSYLAKEQITFIKSTPTLFSLIINDKSFNSRSLSSLNHLMLGGEAIIHNDLTTFFKYYPNKKVINHYGPTEATIGCIIKPLSKENYHQIKHQSIIGRPISNMKVYILDAYLNPVAPGVLGQLYLAGLGVSEGYYKHPELNEGRFIDNPHAAKEQMYATGDLATWSSSYEIVFKGRLDDQLKIRGYRVEIGEIETILLDYNTILNCCVLATTDDKGGNRLVGYIVTDSLFYKEELEEYLSKRLPDYMIPRIWVTLDKMPFTTNGKVDKKELPKPEIGLSSTIYTAPINEIEELLVGIWQKLLNVDKIGVSDNFFELGGDSITAIQVSSHLYKEQYKVEIRDIMRYPTIKEVVGFIKPLHRIAEQGIISGDFKLTPIQEAFFNYKKTQTNYYNQSILLGSQDRVDVKILEETLTKLQFWHDALRSTFKIKDNKISQTIHQDTIPVALKVFDLPEATTIGAIKKEAINIQSTISLEKGPLMQVAVFKTKEIDYVLIVIHHLVVDVVSWRILLEDFYTIYRQLEQNKTITLPIKTDSFKAWSEEIELFINSYKFEQEKIFWEKRISEKAHTPIQFDFETNNKGLVSDRNECTIQLEQNYVTLLETETHKAFNTEINDILLAALGESVYRTFSLAETSIMLESHGRAELNESLNFSRTVGWFTSVYPVYLSSTSNKALGDLIKNVKEHLHKIPNNGIGFGILRYKDEKSATEQIRKIPLPQIAFNYLGNVDENEEEHRFKLIDHNLNIDEASNNQSNHALEFLGCMKNGVLEISLNYHTTQFKEETITKWLANYKAILKEIIDFCVHQEYTETTASDYDYSDLSSDDLVELNDLF